VNGIIKRIVNAPTMCSLITWGRALTASMFGLKMTIDHR
jgi:hypothetical protein